jgi:hypothetical protein
LAAVKVALAAELYDIFFPFVQAEPLFVKIAKKILYILYPIFWTLVIENRIFSYKKE